jgi:class 3 adenylate cyclase
VVGVDQRIDTATVLFSDMVGSTELRTRLGEEAADELRIAHDHLLRSAISAHRGTVVKHTGDGVMATFSAAVDAVAAAVAIQQAVDAHNRRSDQSRFEVRVGISVGDVTFDGDDCFGLPVIEAQRLEAAAEGGQILCAEIVRHLARGRGGYDFTSLGDLALKGIKEPVPAVRVHWAPVVQVAVARETPLPPVLASPSAFDLSGRADELDVVVNAWKDSTEGNGRIVLISGEPGIGKTRLATEAALVARRQGGLVLAGRCDEALGLPYQPFVEALRFQLGLADVLPTDWFGPLAEELARLAPELSDHIPGLASPVRTDAESERARLFDGVTAWLRTTAAAVPVMLVLDDIHWADRPTLTLLRHIVHETSRDALFVVGTYRSTDLDRTHPLAAMLADFRRDPRVARLALDGLTPDGVAEFLERSAGHDLDAPGVELARAIQAETAGNPFFVGEIMRHLVETGALIRRDGRWTSDLTLADVGLPEGIREVVGRRISRLDESAQRTLSVAAVIGHEFNLPVLAEVAGADDDEILDQLDGARAGGLVDEVGLDRYRFAHALVRATLLEELSTSRRVRTHRKVGEAYERRFADRLDSVVTDLAHHFGEAAAADPDKAVRYAMLAGDRALEQSAADDAVRWYEHAREHLDVDNADPAVEVEILTRLARAEWASERDGATAGAHVLEAARTAQAAGLHDAMARALLITTRASFNEEQPSNPDKIDLLEQALRVIDDDALRARLLAALAVELVFVGDTAARRQSTLDEALALARQSGDSIAIAEVAMGYFNSRPRSTWSTAQFTGELGMYRNSLEAARATGDALLISSMHLASGFVAFTIGDGDELRAHAAMLDTMAADGRNPVALRMFLLIKQMIVLIEGRVTEARALALEQYGHWVGVSPLEALTYRGVQDFVAKREQGRLEWVVPAWAEFAAAHNERGAAPAAVAFALATIGRTDEAARRLDAAFSTRFRDIPDEAGWPMAVAMWAETAVLLGATDAARVLHELLLPFDSVQMGTGGFPGGPAARLLARIEDLLGRHGAADDHFAAAVDFSRRIGSPVWAARCQLDWAEALLARGEQGRAAELADAAASDLGHLELDALREQLARLHGLLQG